MTASHDPPAAPHAAPEAPALARGELRLLHELRVHQAQLAMQNEELRRLQAELAASRERYLELYDQAPVGYCTISGEGLILEANLTAAALLNQTRGELLRQRVSRFILDEDQDIHYLHGRAMLDTGQPQAYELRLLRAGSSPFWARLDATVARGPDGSVACHVALADITETRRAEVEVRGLRERLYHADRLTHAGEIVSAIAHELNQPLTGILSNAQAARRRLGGASPDLDELREIVDDIIADDKRAGETIHHLRAFLRSDCGQREAVDLSRLAAAVVKMVTTEMALGEVALGTELAEGLPAVTADPIQIQQVMLNLLTNAAQAVAKRPVGGRRVTLATSRQTADQVVVSVRDGGSGIPPAEVERIFAPFETRRAGGMGLGLSISRTIVEAHGGRIWAESRPLGGAVVSFTLPVAGLRDPGRGK
jgi:PAS domain S-box-containing protein